MNKKGRYIILGICLFLFACSTVTAEEYQKWTAFRDNIKKTDSVARYYAFENLRGAEPVVKNLVGEDKLQFFDSYQWAGEPLAEELEVVPGRFPGKEAVRLNQCSFIGEPFNPSAEGFTVECWIRVNGPGTILDKFGKKNGTILVTGNGWNDGWRVIAASEWEIQFSMGSPGTPKTISARQENGKWVFLTTTWDGKVMKLYVNGQLMSQGPFENYIAPREKRLIIGYDRGHGVGSLLLDIDELIMYNRVLSEQTIKRHYGLETD